MYLYRLPGDDGKVEVTVVGKGPPLSGFQATPEKAAEAVASQLAKAKELIPEASRASVHLSVFATAGMRLVPKAKQDAIYAGLRSGLLGASGGYPFDANAIQARTISGREEGVFALLAANYLTKRLKTTLHAQTSSLMGVLDLGGSSTQVATPPAVGAGEHLGPKLGSDHTFVRSFLNLGMERMRQRTFQHFVDVAPAMQRERKAVANPCSFYGYAEGDDSWRGTGEAAACEAAVRAVLVDERRECAAAAAKETPPTECLSKDPVPVPPGDTNAAKFFLISGYLYVTDFASWVLKLPGARPEALKSGVPATPTIQELRDAATVVCSEPWERLSAVGLDAERKHGFTPPKKLPHRCFELNYIVALLSLGYGFAEDARLFHIVEDIDGLEIEWTLGAFLQSLSTGSGTGDGTPFPEL